MISLDSLSISPSACDKTTTTLTITYYAWISPGEKNPVKLTFSICPDPNYINLMDGSTPGNSVSWDETLPKARKQLTKAFTIKITTPPSAKDCDGSVTAPDDTYTTSGFTYS